MSIYAKIAMFFVRLELRRIERLIRYCDKHEFRYLAKKAKIDHYEIRRIEANLSFWSLKI